MSGLMKNGSQIKVNIDMQGVIGPPLRIQDTSGDPVIGNAIVTRKPGSRVAGKEITIKPNPRAFEVFLSRQAIIP